MSSQTVTDLMSRDPEALWLLADFYSRRACLYEEVAYGFRRIDDGGWYGRAAKAFHARFEQQPQRFLAAADSCIQVAVALDRYAAALAWAQRQAGEVIAWGDEENLSPDPPRPVNPVLTAAQQAEFVG